MISIFSGDIGFQALASWYGWAKNPIIQVNKSRLENISEDIPIVFIYGSRTNVDSEPAREVLRDRGSDNTCLKVRVTLTRWNEALIRRLCLDHSQRRTFLLHGKTDSIPRSDG